MSEKRKKRPRDANQLAKLVVDIAIGVDEDIHDASDERDKDPEAVQLGRRGGLKGGRARAEKLTPEERRDIAKRAALARWGKERG